MHRHDHFGIGSDRIFHSLYIEIERSRVDVHEDRLGTCTNNRTGRGKEREWRSDGLHHLVSTPVPAKR